MPFAESRAEDQWIGWQALSPDEADRLAWKAICKWPTATGFDPVIDGIDYSLLARFYLRHKVARAIRRIRDPEDGRFEEALLAEQSATSTETEKTGPWWLPGDRWEWLMQFPSIGEQKVG